MEEIPKTHEELFAMLEAQAEAGSDEAAFDLARIYASGHAVQQDDATAAQWYMKAAKLGHSQAQWVIAMLYWRGQILEKDDNAAAEWAAKSAKQGNLDGLNLMGALLIQGTGVPRNVDEGIRLWSRAAEQGHKLSQEQLEELLSRHEADSEEEIV